MEKRIEQGAGWALPPQDTGIRFLLPLAVVLIVGVLLYCAWTLLR